MAEDQSLKVVVSGDIAGSTDYWTQHFIGSISHASECSRSAASVIVGAHRCGGHDTTFD
ncbi:hypothetical protein VIBNIAM115_1870103 [Vibrio nigripulchritudo AM115]|nr:hypothetical protein VIBNIAM115_1870103 [Vibrio nigripulchritudo AM115]